MAANVSLTTNFIAFAIPAIVAFIAISMVGKNQVNK
jgi:hypothetical protein